MAWPRIYKKILRIKINEELAVAQLVEALCSNRKVAGSIPEGVIGIFYWHNPSGRTMALGLTQPLTEMSTRSMYIHIYIYTRGSADTSLARHTSRCRRTESIVSLETGVHSCAELQDFSCYRDWKEACQATCAISTTWRRELLSSPSPARQGTEENSHHSDRNIWRTCTIVCHRQKLNLYWRRLRKWLPSARGKKA
jgi:hypothetical protein